MAMHNPPHPGLLVKQALIDEPDLTVTEAAVLIGVGRVTLSRLINGQTGISPEMAVRLSIVLETSSEMWLSMQAMFDLAKAEKKRKYLHLKQLRWALKLKNKSSNHRPRKKAGVRVKKRK